MRPILLSRGALGRRSTSARAPAGRESPVRVSEGRPKRARGRAFGRQLPERVAACAGAQAAKAIQPPGFSALGDVGEGRGGVVAKNITPKREIARSKPVVGPVTDLRVRQGSVRHLRHRAGRARPRANRSGSEMSVVKHATRPRRRRWPPRSDKRAGAAADVDDALAPAFGAAWSPSPAVGDLGHDRCPVLPARRPS